MLMSWLNCTLFILFAIGISGQTNNIDNLRASNVEKGYPFGKLRVSEDGKKEELIFAMDTEKPASGQDQSSNGHPLPSPCVGTTPSTKLAFPKEKTKYIQCRDEFHYEILTCPPNTEYVEQSTSCEVIVPTIDRCEAEKPCLNDGKCSISSNSTIQCTCQKDWVGERCETPLNSCVTKPCGPNADCRALKTIDNEQDYVCLCHGSKGYGLSCREVVSNPCLTTNEQFFPYAFSQRAYVQCNGELIYFQPCGASLYWNQEEKICDRKPPAKIDTPTLITKVVSGSDNQQEINGQDETRTSTTTTTDASVPKGKEDNEGFFAFVPARVANRQQLQSNLNNQQSEKEPKISDMLNQRFQVTDSNLNRPELLSNTNQWNNQQTDTNLRQPLSIQSSRQQWPQSTVQQWASKPITGFSTSSNLGQSQIKQTLPQQQVFTNQQWSNQIPAVKSQAWEGSQIFQNQDTTTTPPQTFTAFRSQGQHWQNQQSFLETTTLPLNDFQNLPEESWQSKPIGQSTQRGQSFLHHPQSWPESQTFLETTTTATLQNPVRFQAQHQSWQTKPISQSFVNQPNSWQNQNQQPLVLETTTPAQTFFNFPSQKLQDQEQSWQTKPLTQSTGNQFSQANNLNTFGQPESWQTSQHQQLSVPTTLEGSAIEKNNRITPVIQQNSQWSIKPQTAQPSWQTRGQNQLRLQQTEPESSMINTQRFRLTNEKTISSPTLQNQQWTSVDNSDSSADLNDARASIGTDEGMQSQNQVFGTQQRFGPQTFVETTTVLSQNIQTPQQQDQSWQNQFLTQQTSSQPIRSQSNQVFAFKPKQWPVETQKVNDQNTPQTSQLWSQIHNQPSTSQFSNQANQFSNLDDTRSIFTSQSGNSFETTSTVPSKTNLQVLLPLSARHWQTGRMTDQQSIDQRLPLDSVSGAWKSRS